MAKNFLVDLNLNQNELQNSALQNLAANPADPIKGQVYFNTATNKFRIFNGTTWDEMGTGGGSVSSVGISNENDNSLVITNSPITSSGVINIEHKNAIAAQTVSGIYPIKIDKSGHITEYGAALGTVTETNDGLLPKFATINKTDNPIDEDDLLYDASTGKYQKLPDTAFENTTYEDGTQGWVLKANKDGQGRIIDQTYATLDSPEFTGVPTAPTAAAGTNNGQIATTGFVANAISGISGGMRFKGTIGVGGSAGTDLPTTGVSIGDTYKISSAGTYDGHNCKTGDMFIATAIDPSWAYIPSGDDAGITSITAGAGLTGGTITSTGTIGLATSGVTAGTYQGISVDSYGRVTNAQNMGYTTNEGTVTSVAITNTGGLSISGGPITSSGTISIGHSNAVAAQTTQAVYPITIDANGHITGYGSAVNIIKKFSADITGDGTTNTFAISHNLGTRDLDIQVYDKGTYDDVIVDIYRTNDNVVTIGFALPPANNKQYRVIIIG